VLSSIAGLLRLASLIICLIVLASFVVFAVDQTGNASTHQQEVLNGGAPTPTTTQGTPETPKTSSPHKSTLRQTLDDAANTLTSPFDGVVSGSSSKWAVHGVKTLLALLLYGFGLGYLARVIRVRV
jgi:hypothetical protein